MEKQKKIVTLFCYNLANVHLIKDVGMVPYTLKKIFNCSAELVSFETKGENYSYLESEVKGLKLRFLKKGLKIPFLDVYFSAIYYLLKNAKKIDVLNLFHFSYNTLLYGYLYKKLNHKGTLYIKLDMRPGLLKENLEPIQTFNLYRKIIKSGRIYFIKNILDMASYENNITFEEVKEIIPEYESKFIYIPNGFSSYNFNKIKTYDEKENIITTVGRIGTEQKNNQKLLSVLSKIDLKSWKVFFIGPIENQFQNVIKDFFKKYSYKKDSIVFVGAISDRKELFEYYNKSKVFCLTSRYEGFALVFPEALRARNYIVTTNVGGAKEITNNGEIGGIVHTEKELYSELKAIIEGDIDLKSNYNLAKEYSKKFNWEYIFIREKERFKILS